MLNNPWASISIDGIKKAMEQTPNKVKTNEKYGKQLMASAKQWDDGSISISVSYQDDNQQWQRINIGKIMEGKDAPASAVATPPAVSDDSPF